MCAPNATPTRGRKRQRPDRRARSSLRHDLARNTDSRDHPGRWARGYEGRVAGIIATSAASGPYLYRRFEFNSSVDYEPEALPTTLGPGGRCTRPDFRLRSFFPDGSPLYIELTKGGEDSFNIRRSRTAKAMRVAELLGDELTIVVFGAGLIRDLLRGTITLAEAIDKALADIGKVALTGTAALLAPVRIQHTGRPIT